MGLVIAMGVLPPSDPEWPRRAARSPGRYDDSFRRYAVKRALEPDVRVADVAGELGVSASTLRRWIKAAGDADTSPAAGDADTSPAAGDADTSPAAGDADRSGGRATPAKRRATPTPPGGGRPRRQRDHRRRCRGRPCCG